MPRRERRGERFRRAFADFGRRWASAAAWSVLMGWNREEDGKGLALGAVKAAPRQVVRWRNIMFCFVECEKWSRFEVQEVVVICLGGRLKRPMDHLAS